MIEIRKIWYYFTRYIDGFLLVGILILMSVGLIVLYSATGANINKVSHQMVNILVALVVMWSVANIPLQQIRRLALPMYIIGLVLLIGVALFGEINNDSIISFFFSI